jgi:arylsulfatase A-like enzyme
MLIMKKVLLFVVIALAFHIKLTAQAKKMNVLFIIADDLNCDISAYNHRNVKTPNLNKLADRGVVFTQAFCNFPLSGPSRACFMTGLYPNQTGLKDLQTYVRQAVPDVVTMPQNFKNNGYISARVGKLFHAGVPSDIGLPGIDDTESWNIAINPRGLEKDEEDKTFSLEPGSFGSSLSWYASEVSDEDQTDGKVATESIKLLEQFAKNDQPFFLGVGFYRPHTPFVAPKKYFELYPREEIKVPQIPEGYLETLPEPAKKILTKLTKQNNLPDSLARSAIQAYYASITFVDAQVGRLLEALDHLGLRENTIIVFTSDNGYHLGEHGYYQKMTLFENSDHIPLIISYPGQKKKGRESNTIVEMIDFYPTLAELAGVPTPNYLAGKSIAPVFQKSKSKLRESAFTQVDESLLTRYEPANGYTLRTQQYRYTRWGEGGVGMIELYDRKKDPTEMNNLANSQDYANVIKRLDEQLSVRIAEASVKPEGLEVLEIKRKRR